MLILSRVCAEFRDGKGKVVFQVRPWMRNRFTEAPEAIREDPLFDMMLADGTLEAVRSVERRKQLENDPTAGTTAAGTMLRPEAGEDGKEAGGTATDAGGSPEAAGAGGEKEAEALESPAGKPAPKGAGRTARKAAKE